MKKRLEDRLIELAFDDRSDSFPAEVVADPAAKLRLGEYRAMRTALGQLRELPEHQLSTERLREALLHQGLKRRRAFPWQALGYGSVAASMFFCAFFVSRFVRSDHGVRIVDPHGDLVASSKVEGKTLSTNLPQHNPASHLTHVVASLHNRHHRVRTYHVVPGPIFATNENHRLLTTASLQGPGNAPLSDSNRRDGDGNPIESGKHPAPSGSSTSDAVVVIGQTDADTGLDTAEEKKGNSNVLVGG